MSLLVVALIYMHLFPAEYQVWGRDLEEAKGKQPPASLLVTFTPGYEVWVPWSLTKNHWGWKFWGEGFYLPFPCLVILNSECTFLCLHAMLIYCFHFLEGCEMSGLQWIWDCVFCISFIKYQKVIWTNNLFAIHPYNFLVWLAPSTCVILKSNIKFLVLGIFS